MILATALGTHLLRSSSWSKPSTYQYALLSSLDPLTEVAVVGYNRINLVPSDANWTLPVAGNGIFSNATAIQFNPMTVTIVGWALIDSTDDFLIVTRAFSAPIVCTVDQPGPYFPIGFLKFTIR